MSKRAHSEDFTDVLIIGAGLSGIGAAYHLQEKCPDKTYAILEAREQMGGTWDLFKYPGIRSDSDMYTLGFSFNPWKDPKAIADGPSILKYIKDTASKFGIDKHIRYSHTVIGANWIEEDALWEVTINIKEQKETVLKCRFLFVCSGYYDYDQGYDPLKGTASVFNGPVVHPQHWPEDLDYTNKKVVVIGSGATAVTLVPELAKKAEKVTMLQRSPTYILNLPREDKIANRLKRILPAGWAHSLSRWKNILFSLGLYKVSRKWPGKIRNFIQNQAQHQLGADYDMRHFTPTYDPWDQRLCLVPDNDLFLSIREGKAQMVTDTIKEFLPNGIALNSGKVLDADIIITATGLKIKLLGGMDVKIGNKKTDTSSLHVYRGVMFSDIPNMAIAVGYTNASWTLKCDLNGQYVARLLNFMDKQGYRTCTPRFDPERYTSEPLLDFDAGYIKRALDVLPKQGSEHPWKIYQNYLKDMWTLKYSKLTDNSLEFK
ncbi:flavin-containing monooxygenase [Robertkochia flava]|uniref:flavin-containing monooxygenase n=1 Tax=Robertkochia flava TaxID=3447986 RepID=UPI001CCF0055|nr:NAD(P)/FAD-dependent oxidoreductase [Robertkochia marina]